jgi:hypothetical protein
MQGILVLGPESSGTRLITKILMLAGCDGQDSHCQEFDGGLPDPVKPIVWRRSVPHGTEWPDISLMIQKIEKSGYEASVVITTRSWIPMIQSQIGNFLDIETGEQAIERIRNAYKFIFGHLRFQDIPFFVSHYESLIHETAIAINGMLQFLDLNPIPKEELNFIYNGNTKYET